ncbi:MAG TPA: response regulator transcription factor [Anaerolineales bacterium]|nr:response regulator transcription factor [Anaerolineales bacterium]HRF48289.1 response regulator transcription factor [Anaerolineales bacterium]
MSENPIPVRLEPGPAAASAAGDRRLRVLVVEDNILVRMRIVATLEAEPRLSVVGAAGTCVEGQALLIGLHPEVLVSDIGLPGTPEVRNGIELIAWAVKRDPRLRAIILTNYTDVAYRQAALRAGAAAFLDKSTEFSELPGVILSLSR